MKQKLDDFYTEWKDAVDSNGQNVLTPDSAKAVRNLHAHIAASCLSNIPPGSGTNQNERFHRFLKSFFNKSRIGISLAYALLSVLMYAHNLQVHSHGKRVVRPISASPFQAVDGTSPSTAMGIVPKSYQQREQGDENSEIDLTQRRVDMHFVVPVYSYSFQKLMISMALKEMNLDKMVKEINCFRPYLSFTDVDDSNETALNQDTINLYGLVLCPSPRDGNCFFCSVAQNILFDESSWENSLRRIGISNYTSDNLQDKQRQAFVHEILENRSQYEGFMINVSGSYETEAKKFLDNGYYCGELGDWMPFAIANVLQTHVVLFRTDTNSPWYITPLLDTYAKPIFLMFYLNGPGHYDCALPYTDSRTISTVEKAIKCSCGVNKTEVIMKVCCPQPRYATRCGCYKNGKSCSSICRCKNCGNPNGTRLVVPDGDKSKRKRRPHKYQKDIPDSKRFALERGESVSEGVWSTFECIVLSQILMLPLY